MSQSRLTSSYCCISDQQPKHNRNKFTILNKISKILTFDQRSQTFPDQGTFGIAGQMTLNWSLVNLSVNSPVKETTFVFLSSVSVINRMLCTHNLPCVLVQLIDCCPWSRFREGVLRLFHIKCVLQFFVLCDKWPFIPIVSSDVLTEGDVEKYINGKWQKVPVEDRLKMTKLDGQVWISLYNLLLKEDCQRKYDFNNFNKNQLLKVLCEWNPGWLFASLMFRVFCQAAWVVLVIKHGTWS